jgi:hypothetical protein
MSFAKRKSGRGPLQRLSDQRRSLALAGLAVGAVFSAAILRRKRRGEEVQFEPPVVLHEEPPVVAQPETEPPAAQPDSGPPAAAEVPPPAAEPEIAEQPEAINAPKPAEAAAPNGASASPPPAQPESAAPVEPATGELSTEEASILAVLAQSGRVNDDRTAIAVATSLERDTGDVTGVLRKLGAEGVVSGDLYTATGDKIWAVTERGVRRLGAQS